MRTANGFNKYVIQRRSQLINLSLLAGALVFGLVQAAQAQSSADDVKISIQISQETANLVAAEWMEFDTTLLNEGASSTPPLAAHLSVAGLTGGQHVDPEDWSPRRTRYLPPLQPGESVKLSWKLHPLFEGRFASFITVISTAEPFPPVVSAALQLQVAPDNILPLGDVIPIVAVVPLFPMLLLIFTFVYRRRR